MTVSMRVMSAGDGYKYLLRSVASGDGDRVLSTPLTRYYTEEGTPPGRWMGSVVTALGGGTINVGDEVSEEQLQRLIGQGRDPVTDQALGSPYRKYPTVAERIEQRIGELDADLAVTERAEAVAAIEVAESTRGVRKAVAGFDFTFSIPKSASVLWAVSDAGTQSLIADAHHAAVAEMVAFIEREVAATRVGAAGRNGAVAQADVSGVIATAFDHYDSRAGDPHLHTYVVISNKVQTVHDGKWRSLDGRPLHAATVALSELHEAVFADHLTRTFGVEWEARDMGRDRNPAWAITTVPERLVVEFSSRTRQIDLRVTIESLDARAELLRASISTTHKDVSALQKRIGKLDAKMNPEKGNLRDLLAKRSEIEKHLGLYEQVKTFEDMIRRIADETEAEVATAVAGLSLTAVREFSAEISKRLAEWDYPSAASVRYDRNELDIIAGDQQRSAHGKGVRAVLHAAFTLALAQYCFDRDLPHPGFVILDSPLVTYRPPDQSTETNDEPPEGVVRAFYRDIEDNFDGQVIVMENTDPLDPLGSDALDIRFTKRVDIGRYGYMPAVADERAVDNLTIEG